MTAHTSGFQANGAATLIGSLPVSDHEQALALIFAHTPEIPLWPQLPGLPAEGMLRQFVEGIPGIVEEKDRLWFDTSRETFPAEMLAYFEHCLAALENPEQLPDSPFTVSPARAQGLYALKKVLPGKTVAAVKGQMTGPFTLLTGLRDQDNRAAWYDPALREMVVKGLSLKAAWQARYLRDSDTPVIIFIDEPALAGLGSSAFITVSPAETAQALNEVAEAIQTAGGLAGIHVCANTDWEFLLGLSIDILSCDAYGFFPQLAACRKALFTFLDRGGILAWGIVPTSAAEDIEKETVASLLLRWEEQAGSLASGAWDMAAILRQTLITPSCGTGALSLAQAEKVLLLTRDLSRALRNKYLAR